jgi:protein-S-isoprenylcysteine O-methyltransferase Ste14
LQIRSTPELVVIALWLAWWVSWMVAAFWRDRASKQPPQRSQIAYRVLAISGAIMLFDRIAAPLDRPLWHLPRPLEWTLVAFNLVGFAFTWWARIHLGRLWSSNVGRKADHHIVDTGPYGVVRHPIYTGIILASLATATLRATAGAWIGVALLTFGWYVKARLEEAFLRQQLGPENYDAYARRVPMLIPFL